MKKLLLLISLGLFCHVTIAQEYTTGEFASIYVDEFLEIQVAEGVFTDASTNKSHLRYFLKYVNKTAENLEFSFVRSTYYQGDCTTCPANPSESQFDLVLLPNEVKSFSLENSDKRFYIFVKDNNNWIKSQLINFEIKSIHYTNN